MSTKYVWEVPLEVTRDKNKVLREEYYAWTVPKKISTLSPTDFIRGNIFLVTVKLGALHLFNGKLKLTGGYNGGNYDFRINSHFKVFRHAAAVLYLSKKSASFEVTAEPLQAQLLQSDIDLIIQSYPKEPKLKKVEIYVFDRNPYVVWKVLNDAKGICAKCNKPAPFNRKVDGSPYLEVHHKIPLADGGDDTVENAEALCPNCHREKHYG
jgi:hypothetical protein